MMISFKCRIAVLAFIAATAMHGTAMAEHLQAAPVMLQLQASQNAEALWLTNPGDTPLQAQIRVYRWTQVEGDDELAPTTELVASPPMVAVPGGQRQMIRVIRAGTTAMPGNDELAYRVVVDEIPNDTQSAGVQFAVRYSIPVFVQTQQQADKAAPVLAWRVLRKDSKFWVQVSNTGQGRAQITEVTFTPTGGKPIVLSTGLYGYALAGSQRIWQLEKHGETMLSGGTLDANINQQREHFVVPPAKNTS